MHLASSMRIMLAARAGSCHGRHSPSFFRYGGYPTCIQQFVITLEIVHVPLGASGDSCDATTDRFHKTGHRISCASRSISRSSASRHDGVVTPNTSRSLVRSKRELCGRLALVG